MNTLDDISEPKWGNKKPFKVPENYFDELPMRIQERIAEEQKVTKQIQLWPTLKPYLSLAAMMLFVAGGVYFGTRGFLTNEKNANSSENVLLADAVYFDEATLAAEYQSNVMSNTSNESASEAEKILINEDISMSDLEQTLN